MKNKFSLHCKSILRWIINGYIFTAVVLIYYSFRTFSWTLKMNMSTRIYV